LTRTDKKNSLIDDPQRCEICNTSLTLYPKDFAACPHCQRRICRQCWGSVWASKAFAAEACAHMAENDGMTMSSMAQKGWMSDWDWQKALFIAALGILAIGTVVFLFNLFIL
jgi:hypothetical protein